MLHKTFIFSEEIIQPDATLKNFEISKLFNCKFFEQTICPLFLHDKLQLFQGFYGNFA